MRGRHCSKQTQPRVGCGRPVFLPHAAGRGSRVRPARPRRTPRRTASAGEHGPRQARGHRSGLRCAPRAQRLRAGRGRAAAVGGGAGALAHAAQAREGQGRARGQRRAVAGEGERARPPGRPGCDGGRGPSPAHRGASLAGGQAPSPGPRRRCHRHASRTPAAAGRCPRAAGRPGHGGCALSHRGEPRPPRPPGPEGAAGGLRWGRCQCLPPASPAASAPGHGGPPGLPGVPDLAIQPQPGASGASAASALTSPRRPRAGGGNGPGARGLQRRRRPGAPLRRRPCCWRNSDGHVGGTGPGLALPFTHNAPPRPAPCAAASTPAASSAWQQGALMRRQKHGKTEAENPARRP